MLQAAFNQQKRFLGDQQPVRFEPSAMKLLDGENVAEWQYFGGAARPGCAAEPFPA